MGNISLKIPNGVKEAEILQSVIRQEEIWKYIDNNIWLEYFLPIFEQRKTIGKDGLILKAKYHK